ncbi:MAG: hypothetical protein ABFC80_09080 [Coriobacteriales bacterium]|nr:hypothetical protein [Actinomycetes bacterium]
MAGWFERMRSRSQAAKRGTGAENAGERPEAVLTRHAGELMRMRGVMSIGVGRDESGRPAIVIGMSADGIAARAAIPKAIDGVPVVINVTGTIEPL